VGTFKRGGVYWYKFQWNGKTIRESTRQGNDKVARQMEAAHRTSLAKGEVGIRDKKAAPTLKEFCEKRFESWAKATFEESSPNNWLWFRGGIRRLTAFEPLSKLPLDQITNEKAAGYTASERVRTQKRGEGKRQGMAVSSINSSLRVLRRILNVAVEWGVIEKAPTIQLLAGEQRRERVITWQEEDVYLSSAPPLLFDLAIVLADTGMRPDEAYRLRWEHVSWDTARHGTARVTHGKTPAARRMLPLTREPEAFWRCAGNAPSVPQRDGCFLLQRRAAISIKAALGNSTSKHSRRRTTMRKASRSRNPVFVPLSCTHSGTRS
jgi:integrase